MPRIYSRLAKGLLVLPMLLAAQGTGRLAEAKRQAMAYAEGARIGPEFDKATVRLEEVWDQDRSDVAVAEALAISYLNGDDRRDHAEVEKKALALMEEALAHGGKATFLVKHSHEHLRLTGRTVTNYCAGKLSIRGGRLAYVGIPVANEAVHSFDLAPSEMEMSEPNSRDGMVQIKFPLAGKKQTFSLLPRNGNAKDGVFLRELARKSLGIQ